MKNLLLLILFTLTSGYLAGQNRVAVLSESVVPGQVFYVQVEVNNADAFVALQLDLNIPKAFTLVDSSFEINPVRKNGQTVQYTILSGGVLRILCYSANNSVFKGHSGWLVRFQLKAGTVPGNYVLTPKNVTLGNAGGTNILTEIDAGTIQLLAPNIRVSTDSLDFGSTAVSRQTGRSFTVQNTGTQVLHISKIIIPDSQFTVNVQAPFSIAAGQSTAVTLTFKPNWKGKFDFPVTLESDDPDEPALKVNITAKAYTINEIHVGKMTVFSGKDADLLISVNNMEKFSGVQFDLILPAPLQYIDGSVAFAGRNTNQQVSAQLVGKKRLRVIAFSAGNTSFTGKNGHLIKLRFNVNGTGGYYSIGIENGMIGGLDGSNILSAEYGGSLRVNAPDISSSTTLKFGPVSSLDIKTIDLQVHNNGSDTLVINHLLFSNPVFTSSASFPMSILIGQSQTIPVQYKDTVKGVYSGTLSIFSNDPDENPFKVRLSGETYIPNYLIIPDQQFSKSQDIWVEVWVRNYEDFVALQFDLNYPASVFKYETDSAQLSSRLAHDQLQITENQAGDARVIIYSMNETPATGRDGSIMRLKFKRLKDTVGTFAFTLSHAIVGNASSQNILFGTQNGGITLLPSAPGAPVAMEATSIDQVSFSAHWQAPASGFTPTGYYLDVATDSLFTSKVSGYDHLDVGLTLTKKVTGLSPKTKYFYRIQGYNTGGSSSYSNIISATTLPSVYVLTVSTDSLFLPAAAGSQTTFTITSNIHWEIHNVNNWLLVSPSSGTGNESITVTADSANNSKNRRTAKLTIYGSGVDTLSVVITQDYLSAISEYSISDQIKVYPNPTAHTLFIKLKGMNQTVSGLKLMNMQGETVLTVGKAKAKSNLIQIDLIPFPKGIYYLFIKLDKVIAVKKILILK